MPISSRLACLAGVLLFCLSACAPSQSTGSIQFAASLQQPLSVTDVTRVKVTVSAPDMSPVIVEMTQSNNSWVGSLSNVAAGTNRSFLAEAFDASGTLRFQGSTSGVSITANQTTAVAITLQQTPPPTAYGNEAPIIESLVASATSVQTGTTISLTAAVRDPNTGDTVSLAWTASGGTFSSPTADSTTWTALTSPGIQTVTLTVTDSQGVAVSVSLAINVLSGAPTSSDLNVAFNLWPVVSKISATPSRVDAGQSTTVSALVSDGDGDPLTYQWASSCTGTWSNATSSTASFVPSSLPAGVCNNCRLTVTVRDARGGQTTGALNLCVAAAVTERFPPRFTNYQQSVASISAGQAVTFDVTAADPQASSLSFAWSTNSGPLATAQNTASTSRVTWTAPSCAVTGVTTTVTSTVTNAYGLSASIPFSPSGLPACPSGWAATGAMATTRNIHTATRLSSGKVLVAGGQASGSVATAVTALYDPNLGTWSASGSMTSPHMAHTATLLNNGKVLVAGGWNGSYIATAELYDPAAGTWSATAPMALARGYHTATLLPNGKVLVAGGWGTGTLTSAEVYDPATGTWSTTGVMTAAHHEHTATLLSNGKVLVTGGFTDGQRRVTHAVAELYDPAAGTWSATGPMATARGGHAATRLSNGKVLVAGGYTGSSYPTAAEVYDPAAGTWSSAGLMVSARAWYTATLLNNGKVLAAGGSNTSGYLATAELYDPASNSWSAAASMASSRNDYTATLLNSGKVLVSGGYSNTNGYLAAAELYTP